MEANPQASRTSFRYAAPHAGGDTSGLAKPVPRYLLEGITPVVGWLMRYRGEAEFTPPRAA